MKGAAIVQEEVGRHRKRFVGIVVRDRMAKTRVVEVMRLAHHPVYGKVIRKRKRYKAHDEKNQSHIGDQVRIVESRPLSKDKCWRITEILRPAERSVPKAKTGVSSKA